MMHRYILFVLGWLLSATVFASQPKYASVNIGLTPALSAGSGIIIKMNDRILAATLNTKQSNSSISAESLPPIPITSGKLPSVCMTPYSCPIYQISENGSENTIVITMKNSDNVTTTATVQFTLYGSAETNTITKVGGIIGTQQSCNLATGKCSPS